LSPHFHCSVDGAASMAIEIRINDSLDPKARYITYAS
jgi:hypothetical protein